MEETKEEVKEETKAEMKKTELNANPADMEMLAALLRDIKDANSKEQKYTKKLLHWMQLTMSIMMLIIILLCVGIATYVPTINDLLAKTNSLAVKSESVMDNLEIVTKELAKVDYEGTINNINGLVVDSQASVNTAMDQITSIDFDGLNKAIGDLESVVAPLAKLFGRK